MACTKNFVCGTALLLCTKHSMWKRGRYINVFQRVKDGLQDQTREKDTHLFIFGQG